MDARNQHSLDEVTDRVDDDGRGSAQEAHESTAHRRAEGLGGSVGLIETRVRRNQLSRRYQSGKQ